MKSVDFKVGDTIRLTILEKRGEKFQKTQFQGVVISKKGKNENKTFTVRKIGTANVAIEKIFPLNSPAITDIKVVKKGNVRRAKLYYLRRAK